MTLLAAAFALYLFSLAYVPLAYVGLVLQSGYLVIRGLELGRLPLVGVHDTLSFLAASCMAFAAALHYGMKEAGATPKQVRTFISASAVIAAVFTAFALSQPPHSTPLPPVLKTYWFELHVATSFFSYALFGTAAVLGGLYLADKSAESPWLERLQYKAAFMGYSLFSISMILGGVWAYLAWGTYWLWTPKELWTSLLWIYYALYLHARLVGGLSGRPSAWLGVVGYALVLFTYLGVGLLMKSSHSF